ncbi:unnamed protein product, partial [Darwinula stevensoni]
MELVYFLALLLGVAALPQTPWIQHAQQVLNAGAGVINDAEDGYKAYKQNNWGTVLKDAANVLGDADQLGNGASNLWNDIQLGCRYKCFIRTSRGEPDETNEDDPNEYGPARDYQNGDYTNGNYQYGDYTNGNYQYGDYTNGNYQNGDYTNGNYQNGDYINGNYQPEYYTYGLRCTQHQSKPSDSSKQEKMELILFMALILSANALSLHHDGEAKARQGVQPLQPGNMQVMEEDVAYILGVLEGSGSSTSNQGQ